MPVRFAEKRAHIAYFQLHFCDKKKREYSLKKGVNIVHFTGRRSSFA